MKSTTVIKSTTRAVNKQLSIGLSLLFCLLFFSACNTQYQSQRSTYNNPYIEIEREVGKTAYDFYWALSQGKTVQAQLYATPKGWKSVTKLKKETIRSYNVERIVLYGKEAEVEIRVNNQKFVKLFLTMENREWMIYDAMAISSVTANRKTKNNKKKNQKNTHTSRTRSNTNQNNKNQNNTSRGNNTHIAKQTLIDKQANAFFSALRRKDISTAEQYATAGGLESVMTLPIDYIDQYKIENIILYGNIADVEIIVNGKVKTLAIMVEEHGEWLVDRTQTNSR